MRKTASVRIRKSTPVETVPAGSLERGAWILAADGTPYEVSKVFRPSRAIIALMIGASRVELPASAPVNRYAV